MTSNNSQRVCMFCDRPGLTREHAWPDWIRNAFPKAERSTHVFRGVSSSEHRVFNSKPVNAVFKGACGKCNNGWMARLEDTVKPLMFPMIQGSPSSLDAPSRTLIALWVLKTGMVLDHVTTSGPLIPTDQVHYLYARREPPPNYCVWAVGCQFQGPQLCFGFSPLTIELGSRPSALTALSGGYYRSFSAHMVTMRVGCFAAQFFWCESLSIAKSVEREDERVRPRLWPPTNEGIIQWPQAILGSIDDYSDFSIRLDPVTPKQAMLWTPGPRT